MIIIEHIKNFIKPTLQTYLERRVGEIEFSPTAELFGVKLPYSFRRYDRVLGMYNCGHTTKEGAMEARDFQIKKFTEEYKQNINLRQTKFRVREPMYVLRGQARD